ncbi:MJ0042-type zinc finger domain-containing protein [Olivibacter oleidegradans]|uniref:MJ0042-type zinc finger domain-containing protein n=1 Tax=Olivibacter oleidegradans TaxID=760123 RepID=A0ABV6HQ04_9SPHI
MDLSSLWFEIECPKCSYQFDVKLSDVKAGKTVFCHNCKLSIKLVDGEASAHRAIETFNSEMNKLDNIFKNFGK